MEGRQEGLEPLDRADDLPSSSGEMEVVGPGRRSMQQRRPHRALRQAPPLGPSEPAVVVPAGRVVREIGSMG
jgi:hypothetical protein